jgi:hypothetical protein
MHLSAVPPPLATKFDCIGLQAMAFTAAWWEENLNRGMLDLCWLDYQIFSLLSFPPEARNLSSKDHFRPHISCLWASIFDI